MPRRKDELTLEDQQKLAAVLVEMRNRGLNLPTDTLQRTYNWQTDSRGYFTKSDGSFFNPNEHQEAFINSNARFVALVSGRGGGKSASGSQKALQKIRQGLSGAVINPDFENFKISTWLEFKEWIPWELIVPGQRYRRQAEWTPHQPFQLAFLNGAVVICKGLKDEDSARGPNINWLWYDEAGRDRTGRSWQIAEASVRIPPDPQSWITTTPRGRTHWIYKFFVKREIPEDAVELFEKEGGGRELIFVDYMTIYDNIDNLDPGFVASMLAAYPVGWLRDQEIFGKFVDESGSLGDRSWFNGKILPERPETVLKRIRYWDLAASEKKTTGRKANDPDETVGTLLSTFEQEKFCIENQTCGFWEWAELKTQVLITAERDGPYVPIYIEQEPAAGGKNQVAELQLYIREQLGSAWVVKGHRPEGDKVMRANPWFSEASEGKFYLVEGNWNEGFLEQLAGFPDNVDHDDKIDSVSGARQIIAPFRKWSKVPFLKL